MTVIYLLVGASFLFHGKCESMSYEPTTDNPQTTSLCCPLKTVGDITYALIEGSPSEIPARCKSNCLYYSLNDTDSEELFCFAPGRLPKTCHVMAHDHASYEAGITEDLYGNAGIQYRPYAASFIKDKNWKVSFIHTEEAGIVKGVQLGSILTGVPQSYKLTFEFKITNFPETDAPYNILRFIETTGTDCCQPGDRIPGVFIVEKKFLFISTNYNNVNTNIKLNKNPIYEIRPSSNWHTMEFVQTSSSNGYVLTIFYDKARTKKPVFQQFWTVAQPQTFGTVNVYASDNYYQEAPGSVKNIIFSILK